MPECRKKTVSGMAGSRPPLSAPMPPRSLDRRMRSCPQAPPTPAALSTALSDLTSSRAGWWHTSRWANVSPCLPSCAISAAMRHKSWPPILGLGKRPPRSQVPSSTGPNRSPARKTCPGLLDVPSAGPSIGCRAIDKILKLQKSELSGPTVPTRSWRSGSRKIDPATRHLLRHEPEPTDHRHARSDLDPPCRSLSRNSQIVRICIRA